MWTVRGLLATALFAALQAAAIASLDLELSSHTCSPASQQNFRTCTFRNLVLQDGQAYYLANSAPQPAQSHACSRPAFPSPPQLTPHLSRRAGAT